MVCHCSFVFGSHLHWRTCRCRNSVLTPVGTVLKRGRVNSTVVVWRQGWGLRGCPVRWWYCKMFNHCLWHVDWYDTKAQKWSLAYVICSVPCLGVETMEQPILAHPILVGFVHLSLAAIPIDAHVDIGTQSWLLLAPSSREAVSTVLL